MVLNDELDDLAWKSAERVCQSIFSNDRDELWDKSYELAKKAIIKIIVNPKKYGQSHKEIHKAIFADLGLDRQKELDFCKQHCRRSSNIEGVFWEVLDYLIEDMNDYGILNY